VGQGAAREGGVPGAARQDDDPVIDGAISLYRVNKRLLEAVLDQGLHNRGATPTRHKDLHYALSERLVKDKELLH
jgi:hypothetical protein